MKKSYKPEIFRFILTATTVLVFVILYVWLKLKIDNTVKENAQLNQWKGVLKNKNLNLLVELQELSAEDRICSIAYADLGMVKKSIPEEKVNIESEFIKIKIEEYKEIYE